MCKESTGLLRIFGHELTFLKSVTIPQKVFFYISLKDSLNISRNGTIDSLLEGYLNISSKLLLLNISKVLRQYLLLKGD